MIDQQKEIWKPVVGYESVYEISNIGRIRRISPEKNTYIGKILSAVRNSRGYLQITLCLNGIRKTHSIHVLIAKAFLGPRPTPHHMVRHLNDNQTDNKVDNISWGTYSDNSQDAKRNGRQVQQRGSKHGRSILKEEDIPVIRKRLKNGETLQAVASDYSVNFRTISLIKTGKRWGWLK